MKHIWLRSGKYDTYNVSVCRKGPLYSDTSFSIDIYFLSHDFGSKVPLILPMGMHVCDGIIIYLYT